jgi:hypothetical protein
VPGQGLVGLPPGAVRPGGGPSLGSGAAAEGAARGSTGRAATVAGAAASAGTHIGRWASGRAGPQPPRGLLHDAAAAPAAAVPGQGLVGLPPGYVRLGGGPSPGSGAAAEGVARGNTRREATVAGAGASAVAPLDRAAVLSDAGPGGQGVSRASPEVVFDPSQGVVSRERVAQCQTGWDWLWGGQQPGSAAFDSCDSSPAPSWALTS